jgi:hypothetical protein
LRRRARSDAAAGGAAARRLREVDTLAVAACTWARLGAVGAVDGAAGAAALGGRRDRPAPAGAAALGRRAPVGAGAAMVRIGEYVDAGSVAAGPGASHRARRGISADVRLFCGIGWGAISVDAGVPPVAGGPVDAGIPAPIVGGPRR